MSNQPETSVRNAVDGMIAPNPPDMGATPSTEPLQTIAIPDSRAPRSITTTTTSEQGLLVRPTTDASTSARPSAEETAILGHETSRRDMTGWEPTIASFRPDSPILSQENDTPELEDITTLSAGVTSMSSSAESPLSHNGRSTTSGQERSTGTRTVIPLVGSLAEPSLQSATLQDAPPWRADPSGAVLPITPHAEPETLASAQQNDALHLEGFFAKYKNMVRPETFGEFRSILGRERNFRAQFTGRFQRFLWKPSMMISFRELNAGTLLIEDADIECILALDAKFNLDPRFIVCYVNYYRFREQSNPPSKHQSYRPDGCMTGSWYVNGGTTIAAFSVPPRAAQRSFPKFFNRGEVTNAKCPWWREACRQQGSTDGKDICVTSKIACYRLSNDLSKLRLKCLIQIVFPTHAGWQVYSWLSLLLGCLLGLYDPSILRWSLGGGHCPCLSSIWQQVILSQYLSAFDLFSISIGTLNYSLTDWRRTLSGFSHYSATYPTMIMATLR